jgi:hypothetical protein
VKRQVDKEQTTKVEQKAWCTLRKVWVEEKKDEGER